MLSQIESVKFLHLFSLPKRPNYAPACWINMPQQKVHSCVSVWPRDWLDRAICCDPPFELNGWWCVDGVVIRAMRWTMRFGIVPVFVRVYYRGLCTNLHARWQYMPKKSGRLYNQSVYIIYTMKRRPMSTGCSFIATIPSNANSVVDDLTRDWRVRRMRRFKFWIACFASDMSVSWNWLHSQKRF